MAVSDRTAAAGRCLCPLGSLDYTEFSNDYAANMLFTTASL